MSKYNEFFVYTDSKRGSTHFYAEETNRTDLKFFGHFIDKTAFDDQENEVAKLIKAHDEQVAVNKALQSLLKDLEPVAEKLDGKNKVIDRLLAEIKRSTDRNFYEHCLNKVKELTAQKPWVDNESKLEALRSDIKKLKKELMDKK